MTALAPGAPYPVRVDATPPGHLSRWLWLVKWFLAIPHLVVLAFLWIAFGVLSVVAFVSILFTGRYPRGIFDFNVGVLRWHWRVAYYSYAAFGTDRYPPFTLAEVPDYPAHLHVAYPERLSRGLVLVKWWLLAIPHYLVVALFVGSGTWFGWRLGEHGGANTSYGGLIALLALIGVVVLAFTGRYPRSIFDFVLGMDRWVLRVAAYAALMTDRYPPFRLDMGGPEPGGTLTVPPPPEPDGPSAQTGQRKGWTGGRVAMLVVGILLGLVAIGGIGGGGTLLWADRTQRDDGYVTTATTTYRTSGYALATDRVELPAGAGSLVGTVRLRVVPSGSGTPVFVGVARADDVEAYLSGTRYATVTGAGTGTTYRQHDGGAPAVPPAGLDIWAARATGAGAQSLTWHAEEGGWMVVVMNADASATVVARMDAGATVPALPWVAAGLLAGGAVLLAGAVLLVVTPVRRASR